MKNTITLLIACCAAVTLFAQQVPYLHSYASQPRLFNPAAQGANGGGFGIAYRTQYSELEESPRTILLNADLSPFLGSERIGVGVLLLSDKAHVINRTQATGFFGYHLLPADNPFRASLGVMAGVSNQKFDFKNRRINNPDDLTLFSGAPSEMTFDGGLGAMATYGASDESQAWLHLVLPQLFSSDVKFEQSPGATGGSGSYDLLPHGIVSAGYRYRGAGFSLEPSIAYRENLDAKKQKAGNLDLNLSAWLLEDERLLVGGGWRSDGGGLHATLGVKPIANLQITGVFETHSALGSSIELGIFYGMGQEPPCGKNPSAEEQIITQSRTAAESAYNAAFSLGAGMRDKIALAKTFAREAETALSYEVKETKIAKADQNLQQAEANLEKIKAETLRANTALGNAEQAERQALSQKRKACNAEEIEPTRQFANNAQAIRTELSNKISEAKQLVEKARPQVDIKQWVNKGETSKLQNFFSGELSAESDKPEGAELTGVTAKGALLLFEYAFPDEREAYNFDKPEMLREKAFAAHLAQTIEKLKSEGVQVESVRITGAVQYSQQSSKFSVAASYGGEWGNKPKVEFKYNGKTESVSYNNNGKSLNFWDLAVLKAYSLKRFLAQNSSVPLENISLEITAPNSSSSYSLRNSVVISVKK